MAIKAKLSYRMDALIGIFGFLCTNTVAFFTLYLTISSIPSLGDWSIEKMVFLYGICLIPKSIDHIFTDNIWAIGNSMVIRGDIDPYLIRPLDPLFQIIASNFQYEGFGELALGIVFVILYAPLQPIVWGWGNILPLIVCEFFAIFLFTAIKLLTATISFWTKRSMPLMSGIYELSNFTKYPLEIFHQVIRILMVYIIPFSLVMYYPIADLYLGLNIWPLTGIIAGVVISLCLLAYAFWKRGLKKYEGAGS